MDLRGENILRYFVHDLTYLFPLVAMCAAFTASLPCAAPRLGDVSARKSEVRLPRRTHAGESIVKSFVPTSADEGEPNEVQSPFSFLVDCTVCWPTLIASLLLDERAAIFKSLCGVQVFARVDSPWMLSIGRRADELAKTCWSPHGRESLTAA